MQKLKKNEPLLPPKQEQNKVKNKTKQKLDEEKLM